VTSIDEFYEGMAEILTAEWRDYASCVDYDQKLFFEEDYYDQGKEVCNGCSVRIDCLDSALSFNDGFLRGGLTEHERNSIELHRKRHLASFRFDLGYES
jgi:WhiB family redox-sensing transcriptional regulator